jgi:ADP-ribose pyrophosphatase YjhB (NUDIX family)
MDDVTPPELSALRYKILTRVAHAVYAVIKGMTIGVRAACFDDQGRIFLVRHSYIPGWHMPGGGVERGETVYEAIAKELREEGNLEMTEPPEMLRIYFNRRTSKRDHVVFFRCKVAQTAPFKPNREIVENGFFALDALPIGTTSATYRRLKEMTGEMPYESVW